MAPKARESMTSVFFVYDIILLCLCHSALPQQGHTVSASDTFKPLTETAIHNVVQELITALLPPFMQDRLY
jgi:hypothetical protein